MTMRLGSWLSRSSWMNALPNDPVPPVTRIEESDRTDIHASVGDAGVYGMMSRSACCRRRTHPEGAPMRINVVIQARTGSTRLPGKVLEDLGGHPVLEWVVRAAKAATQIDTVIVATSTLAGDDVVAELAESFGVPVVRGSEDDVLSRYVAALDAYPADAIVRLTADCPLLDPTLIDAVAGAWAGSPHPRLRINPCCALSAAGSGCRAGHRTGAARGRPYCGGSRPRACHLPPLRPVSYT